VRTNSTSKIKNILRKKKKKKSYSCLTQERTGHLVKFILKWTKSNKLEIMCLAVFFVMIKF